MVEGPQGQMEALSLTFQMPVSHLYVGIPRPHICTMSTGPSQLYPLPPNLLPTRIPKARPWGSSLSDLPPISPPLPSQSITEFLCYRHSFSQCFLPTLPSCSRCPVQAIAIAPRCPTSLLPNWAPALVQVPSEEVARGGSASHRPHRHLWLQAWAPGRPAHRGAPVCGPGCRAQPGPATLPAAARAVQGAYLVWDVTGPEEALEREDVAVQGLQVQDQAVDGEAKGEP